LPRTVGWQTFIKDNYDQRMIRIGVDNARISTHTDNGSSLIRHWNRYAERRWNDRTVSLSRQHLQGESTCGLREILDSTLRAACDDG